MPRLPAGENPPFPSPGREPLEQRVTIAVPGAVPGAERVSAALAGEPTSSTIVVLAHGAGSGMDSESMRVFHAGLAARGCLAVRFNFPYKEARRKLPDRRPLLETCYRAAADFARGQSKLPAPRQPKIVLGGKSMGGRIASHLVAAGYPAHALVFLGYPLHPPAKPQQIRDQHLYSIRRPMLFLSGTRDVFARRDLLAPVVERLSSSGPGCRATLAWIEDGDHSFRVRGRPQMQVYTEALDTIVGWLTQVLKPET